MRSPVVRGLVVVVLVVVALAMSSVTAVATEQASPAVHVVEVYPPDSSYVNSTKATVSGVRAADGGCTFQPPELVLGPGQQAVASRQLSADFTACTTVVETGTPTVLTSPQPAADAQVDTGTSVATTTPASPTGSEVAAATHTSQGYYAVHWWDVVGLRVTGTYSYLRWNWNGSCTGSTQGWYYTWWRSGTGWHRDSVSSTRYPACTVTKVRTSATYHNSVFCHGATVRNYVVGAEVRGWNSGAMGGSVQSTYTTYPSVCPHLHWTDQLIRQAG
jgi:hypothetical protein